jgi:dipeptidyl aminopeptidase/acylaminoacyl peptidase
MSVDRSRSLMRAIYVIGMKFKTWERGAMKTRWFAGMTVGLVMASGIASMAQSAPSSQTSSAATQAATAQAQYVGTYANPAEPEVVLSISVENGQLYSEGVRAKRLALQAESPDHFVWEGVPAKVVFERDASGKVIAASIQYNAGATQRLLRTGDEAKHLNHFRAYSREEVMIPVRDGVSLHTVILRPEGSERGEKLRS